MRGVGGFRVQDYEFVHSGTLTLGGGSCASIKTPTARVFPLLAAGVLVALLAGSYGLANDHPS
jgi:hypothetical protein